MKSPIQAVCIGPGIPILALNENTETPGWNFTKFSNLGYEPDSVNKHVYSATVLYVPSAFCAPCGNVHHKIINEKRVFSI